MISKIPLNEADRRSLRQQIKLYLFFTAAVLVGLMLLFSIALAIFLCFSKPAEGVGKRMAYYLIAFFLIFSGTCVPALIDLIRGRKLRIVATNYEIIKKKEEYMLHLIDGSLKPFKIYDYILPAINISQPLIIEMAPISKHLFFIAHDEENLITKLSPAE